jgi:RHS repeat-associated protein
VLRAAWIELESMYEPGGTCTGTPSKCTRFTYDDDGSLMKTAYLSGASMLYKRAATTGRVLMAEADGTKGETLLSNKYGYADVSADDTPLIYLDTFSGPGGVTAETDYTYEVEKLSRLTQALTKSATAAYRSCYGYRYDAVGNITRNESTPSSEACSGDVKGIYSTGNELECRVEVLVEACTKEKPTEIAGYSYNGAGDETAITGYLEAESTSFAYNNINQLEGLTPPGIAEEKLKYLGSGQSKLTGLGTATLQNSALGVTKQTIAGSASYYARTPGGTLVDERLPGGVSYNPVYDAQGDIVGLLNSSGELVQTIRYGPYGENANTTATEVGAHGAAYSPTNDPFLYHGGYHAPGGNPSSGLYHFGERYYDPTTGHWTQQDPFGRAGSPEGGLYGFAGDDPVNSSDPTGLCDWFGCVEDAWHAVENAQKDNPVYRTEDYSASREHVDKELEAGKGCYEGASEAHELSQSGLPPWEVFVAGGGCLEGAA